MLMENTRKYRQAREARLPIVADAYKKGLSIRKICEEVNNRLDMNVSTRTVHNDIKLMLAEWRKLRIDNIEDLVTLELSRIDDCVAELWEQWEKSKENYTKITNSKIGVPNGEGEESGNGGQEIVTVRRQQSDTNVVALGNPAYIAEIRNQLAERRKLLGLYDNTSRIDLTTGGKPFDTKFEIEIVKGRDNAENVD